MTASNTERSWTKGSGTSDRKEWTTISQTVTIRQAAELLLGHDNIVILTHRKPDGDTLGSGFALLYALEALGKTARVENADGCPAHYRFLYGDYRPGEFAPGYIVAVDVASFHMLDKLGEKYPRVNLCVDHHGSNGFYADHTLLDADAPAAAQILYRVILAMGVTPDKRIADCLFTGLTTDTGCFRYSNVRSDTHRLAAELMDRGARAFEINKRMFDTRSRGRVEVEKLAMESMEFHHDGHSAVTYFTGDVMSRLSLSEEDMDGISSLPRTIEGVLAGVTIRQNPDGKSYRVSLRTEPPVDACRICAKFGGGGHARAAGCTLHGEPDDVKRRLLEAVGEELPA